MKMGITIVVNFHTLDLRQCDWGTCHLLRSTCPFPPFIKGAFLKSFSNFETIFKLFSLVILVLQLFEVFASGYLVI